MLEIIDLLSHMGRLHPEPLEAFATSQSKEWRLGELRSCLIDLERAGIVHFLGRDRWKLCAEHRDVDAALRAARGAGVTRGSNGD
jgi:hypothetical protein